jgi:hypothetical protein
MAATSSSSPSLSTHPPLSFTRTPLSHLHLFFFFFLFLFLETLNQSLPDLSLSLFLSLFVSLSL